MNDSREHILSVSLLLFLQKSFKEVTMKEIVERTGLSKGAFYHYFNSKEQVFEEVIRFFFSDFFVDDFHEFSHESLQAFTHDTLKAMDSKIKSAKLMLQSKTDTFTANHYYLLFDALKMLPNFKQELIERQKVELKAWTRIITIARKNGEILTALTDEQVAKLFIFSGDGIGINLIMMDEMPKTAKELKIMWDNIYSLIKK